MPRRPKNHSTNVGDISTKRDRQATIAGVIAERVRVRASERNISYTDVMNALGIPSSSMANYWAGKRPWPLETMGDLADLLSTSVDALLGRMPSLRLPALVDASDADWVELPEYDLRYVTDETKGELIGRATFRRDWLYLALGESSDLWITRTLTPDAARGLPVGSAIVCKDHPRGEPPIEGRFYIFRVGAGVMLARFSYRAAGGIFAAGDRVGETVVTPADLDREDGQHFIIARALGALARPLV